MTCGEQKRVLARASTSRPGRAITILTFAGDPTVRAFLAAVEARVLRASGQPSSRTGWLGPRNTPDTSTPFRRPKSSRCRSSPGRTRARRPIPTSFGPLTAEVERGRDHRSGSLRRSIAGPIPTAGSVTSRQLTAPPTRTAWSREPPSATNMARIARRACGLALTRAVLEFRDSGLLLMCIGNRETVSARDCQGRGSGLSCVEPTLTPGACAVEFTFVALGQLGRGRGCGGG